MTTAQPHHPDDLLAHTEALRRLARALLQDRGLAEDVVQQAFVAALERPPRSRAALGAWLQRVVRRKAMDLERSRQRRNRRERTVARPEAVPSHTEIARSLALQREVVDAVAALPEPYLTVVYQRYYENLTPRAIAAKRGVPVKTVKTQLWRGLEMLRSRFDVKHRDRRIWATMLLPIGITPPPPAVAAMAPAAAGVLAMKLKVAVGAMGLVLLSALFLVLDRDGTGQDPPERPDHDPQLIAEGLQVDVATNTAMDSPSRRVVSAEPVEDQESTREPTTDSPSLRSLRVRVVRARDDSPVMDTMVLLIKGWDRTRPTRTATTDDEGRVTFENPPTGPVALQIPQVPSLRSFDLGLVDLTTEVLVKVPAGLTVRGRVTDDHGTPIANARVVAYSYNMSPQLVTHTDETGRYSLEDVHHDITLEAQHDDFGPSLVHPLNGEPGDEVTLHLSLTTDFRRISGSVLDPSGRPAALAQVAVVPRDAIGFLPAEVHSRAATTVCDARGRYEIRTRPCEDGPLLAIAIPPDLEALAPSSAIVPGKDNDATDLNIHLRMGATIEGRVHSTQPLERGATAQAWSTDPDDAFAYIGNTIALRVTTIDAQGRFRMTGLPAGVTRTVIKNAMGHNLGEAEWNLSDGGVHDWVVDADAVHSLRIRVNPARPAATMKGPEWSALLYRLTAEGREFIAVQRIYSSEGATFSNLNPEDHYEVRVRLLDVLQRAGRRIDVGVTSTGPLCVGDSVQEISIPSHEMPTSSVLGRLVDTAGHPLGGVSLTLTRNTNLESEIRSYARVRTEPDGTFALAPITAGAWQLEADSQQQDLVEIPTLGVGQAHDCGDLVLR